MKKRISKALENLSKSLPPSYVIRPHTEEAALYVFYQKKDEGVDLPDLPVMTEDNMNTVFKIKSNAVEVLNHHKRLKEAYTQNGTKGVQNYIIWVNQYNRKFIESHPVKSPEDFIVDEGLLKIALGGVAEFWKSLILFLYSFVAVFSTKSAVGSYKNAISNEESNQ